MSSHDKAASHRIDDPAPPRTRRPWHTPTVIVSELDDTHKLPLSFDIVTALGVLGPAS